MRSFWELMPVRAICTGMAYFWMLVSLVFWSPLAMLLAIPLGRRAHDWCTVPWSYLTLRLAMARLEVCGLEHVERGGTYIVVANHQSIIDIPALFVALAPRIAMRFMAKRPIFWVPLLGVTMYVFGHVPVDRGSARKTLSNLRNAEGKLYRGISFLFFPEGTRTSTGRMAPFKPTAFRIAARAKVRVLPVTISGAFEGLPKFRFVIGPSPRVVVTVHPPIAPSGESASAAEALSAEAWRAINGGLPEAHRDDLAANHA